MDLRSVDLNLLVVLQQLLQERHVSRAAEQLHMSQPAVSRALQRLRDMFDDELLVRTSHGYDLSARAESLLAQLDDVLECAERLIAGPVFDPSTSTQSVRFFGPDPEINWLLPPLFARMRKLAPNMVLETRSDPRDHFELLEAGDVHFVLSPFRPSANTSQLRSIKLAKMDFAILMSADNPLAKSKITINKFIAANHGVVSLTGRGIGMVEKRLLENGRLAPGQQLHVPLCLSNFTAIASFCESSDVLFHLPRSFAAELAHGRNLILQDSLPDIEMKDFYVYLYWHERYHKDPMCCWIREQLKESL